jgi:hypothetical protein
MRASRRSFEEDFVSRPNVVPRSPPVPLLRNRQARQGRQGRQDLGLGWWCSSGTLVLSSPAPTTHNKILAALVLLAARALKKTA